MTVEARHTIPRLVRGYPVESTEGRREEMDVLATWESRIERGCLPWDATQKAYGQDLGIGFTGWLEEARNKLNGDGKVAG